MYACWAWPGPLSHVAIAPMALVSPGVPPTGCDDCGTAGRRALAQQRSRSHRRWFARAGPGWCMRAPGLAAVFSATLSAVLSPSPTPPSRDPLPCSSPLVYTLLRRSSPARCPLVGPRETHTVLPPQHPSCKPRRSLEAVVLLPKSSPGNTTMSDATPERRKRSKWDDPRGSSRDSAREERDRDHGRDRDRDHRERSHSSRWDDRRSRSPPRRRSRSPSTRDSATPTAEARKAVDPAAAAGRPCDPDL